MNSVLPMNPSERSPFEQCALAGGLLTPEQLDEARSNLRRVSDGAPPTDRQLADHLVETGVLNAWQAGQLLNGRTKFHLGPYLIINARGQGGMGQVYKARHGKIGRIVAVKVLPLEKSTPEAVANFTREIRAAARLNHPRLVAALDAGQDGSVYYLVTEYVQGTDLYRLVREQGPLDQAAAAAIIAQTAEALEYAHAEGVVHRDVKPGNVLIARNGEAKLSDLGLSGPLYDPAEEDPRRGKVVGTADYLSPDHIRDPWNPTPAWDIYSLGCTLYYAVTGSVPFPGGTSADKIRAHCVLRPTDPRRLNPSLSAEFAELIGAMTAKAPEDRIGTAREVRERLIPFLPGAPAINSNAAPAAKKTETPPRVRNPWADFFRTAGWSLAASLLAVLALAGLALLLLHLEQRFFR